MPEPRVLHLPDKYAQEVHRLLKLHIPRAEVWAYGSRVQGDFYEASDLDLVARFPPSDKPELFRLSEVTEAFQESNLPILVQIVDWDRIPQAFRDEISAGYVVIQAGEPAGSDETAGEMP